MKILVTGATGFIGTALCRALCERGDDVIVFHRPTSNLTAIHDLPVQFITGDLSDLSSIENAFALKPEVVVHLGALQVSGRTSEKMMDVNIGGTRRVFQAAFQSGVSRVILMSSALCMGYAETPADLTAESSPINEHHGWSEPPVYWPFAYSKVLAEQEAQWASVYGMDVVICNPFLVAGAGDSSRKITGMINRILTNPPSFVVDGGINIVHVQDVVRGILNAISYGRKGERYLLSGTNISFSNLFSMAAELAGRKPPQLQLPLSISSRIFHYKNTHPNLFSSSGLVRDLTLYAGKFFYYDDSWSRLALKLPPPLPLKTIFKETLTWYEEQNETKNNLPAA